MISEVAKYVSPIYMVGGSVRDQYLGKEPKDYDFATPLDPDAIEDMIKAAGKKAYAVGKKFGTVGMKLDGQKIEITTFRSEEYTPGSRKPKVTFVNDIVADLSRRDFTINAMAIKHNDKLIDPFGGRIDLMQKTIRCVGEPKHRFREDPLRLLRAARFVSQLEFTVDQSTAAYMRKMASCILFVSRERWNEEMDKLLMGPGVQMGLEHLWRSRLMNFMFPELSLQYGYDQDTPHHRYALHGHTALVVQNSPLDLNMRWAALFHDAGKPFTAVKHKNGERTNYIDHELVSAHIVLKYARYLNWSNERRDTVYDLVLNHMKENSPLRKADNAAK